MPAKHAWSRQFLASTTRLDGRVHVVTADLTLVIDVGKSHARVLMVDDSGAVVARYQRDNHCIASPLGYPALDVQGLEMWMRNTVKGSGLASRCGRAIATTHGAAFVALCGDELAWQPLDYEFDDLQSAHDFRAACARSGDAFASTLSPDLPAGLNAARQLFWLQHAHPDAGVWRGAWEGDRGARGARDLPPWVRHVGRAADVRRGGANPRWRRVAAAPAAHATDQLCGCLITLLPADGL